MSDIGQVIEEKLEEIERRERVRILHAVESGSRAWGFASPDSDFDVRFIYVRPVEEYLRLDESRDVIEWQLDEVLDINGWDLKKALRQFFRGNATLFEWSNSPVVYRTGEEWGEIRAVSEAYFSEKSAVGHYYGMAANTCRDYLQGERVSYKKYLYALRPLLAAVYIERFHQAPPVLFERLLEMEIDGELLGAIRELLERKRVVGEKELRPHIPVIRQFIEVEVRRQKLIADSLTDDHNKDWTALTECFRRVIGYGKNGDKVL